MDSLVKALAEPWARWWGSQNIGAALAFWAAGLLAWAARRPGGLRCARASHDTWCQIQQAGTAGTVVAVVAAAAVVAGSALLVGALAPWLIRFLSGAGWPYQGSITRVSRPAARWLIRRQVSRRGRLAAAGGGPPAEPDPVDDGPGARRRNHEAIARYAEHRAVDRSAAAGLRRYPDDRGLMAPTRIGCALAAVGERVGKRHALDLEWCWEPLLAVLPAEPRQLLASESLRVTQRGQGLVWSVLALVWTALIPFPWAVLWVLAALLGACLLNAGLRDAACIYCDLVEALVAANRHLLYRSLGLDPPESAAAELSAGRRLSDYLAGRGDTGLVFRWAVAVPEPEGGPGGS